MIEISCLEQENKNLKKKLKDSSLCFGDIKTYEKILINLSSKIKERIARER